MTEEYLESSQLKDYLAQSNQDMRSPTQEPYYGQIDPNLVAIVLQHSTEEKYVTMVDAEGKPFVATDASGAPLKDVKITRPDIYNYLIPLSHLARTSNLDRDKSKMYWFMMKKRLRRSRAMYRTNKEIMDLLGKIEDALFIVDFGDAEGGKRQKYLATSVRGIQIVSQQDKDKPWWSR